MFNINLSKTVKCKFTKFAIKLPAGHKLPEYQKAHPKYDRFLPHIAKFLNPSDVVIDIGANVGDTLAGMVDKNPVLHYICIEPDDSFYKYLLSNIELIKNTFSDLRVDTIKSLIGKNVTDVELKGVGGTKHATFTNSNGIQSISLDSIIENMNNPSVRLLKTDVDGYDYDVLDSSFSLLEDKKPIIFFECQYDQSFQIDGYKKTVTRLTELGYQDWTIFDNFGGVVLRTSDIGALFHLIDYVALQNSKGTSRTMYYLDVLAVVASDSVFIDKVLSEY